MSLKYITVGSYAPICIVKAAFHSSPSLILILLYPHLKSNFMNTFLLLTSSKILVISGNR